MREKSIIHATVATTRNGVDGGQPPPPQAARGGKWAAGAGRRRGGEAKGPGDSAPVPPEPRPGAEPGPEAANGRVGGTDRRARGGRTLTGAVGLAFEDVQLGAVGQRVLQAELEEAGLGLAHALEQRQQRNSLLAFVPALKPAGQHPDLVAKHHG